MQTLRLVLVDLWVFVASEFSGRSTVVENVDTAMPNAVVDVPEKQRTTVVVPTIVEGDLESSQSAMVSRPKFTVGQDVFVTFPDTPCYLRPALVRDTILGTFAYAESVQVVADKGQWIQVSGDRLEGWTERGHLCADSKDVLPTFVTNESYDANHPETHKLRTWIKDEFAAAMLGLPALNSEYVWFRMLQNRTVFTWPPLRPRTPGRWSELLRPEPSVHVSAVPLTGSIMEYTDQAKVAQLWYVEAVTPEEAVSISGFAGDDTGTYHLQTLSKDEWTQLKPRYIIKK